VLDPSPCGLDQQRTCAQNWLPLVLPERMFGHLEFAIMPDQAFRRDSIVAGMFTERACIPLEWGSIEEPTTIMLYSQVKAT
jgi:hypothetical protein